MLQLILLAGLVSWGITLLLIVRGRRQVRRALTGGHALAEKDEPQRFHQGYVPRVGGVSIMVGLVAGMAWAAWKDWASPLWFGYFLLCVFPAWLAGLHEDMTRHTSISIRLGSTLLAAGCCVFLLDAQLGRLDIPYVDELLQRWPLFAIVLTIVAVGGLPHALNIIDGFNGLAGMVALLILSAFGYLAFKLGDSALLAICLALGASTAGFFFWNFPRGLIFAGDGGAYLWGIVIAFVAVLLVSRHPTVSPWFPMMVCIYPVCETLFSVYRKKILRKRSPLQPDGLHLHMLIHKRLVRWVMGTASPQERLAGNSLTAPYLWGVSVLSIFPALFFWGNSAVLASGCLLFVLLYLWLYRKLVRFRSPGILKIRRY